MHKAAYLADVDACVPLTKCMSVPEFGDDRDGVETSVLRKRRGDNLEGIRVCLETIRLHALEGVSVLREHSRYMDLWCTTTRDQCPTEALSEDELIRSAAVLVPLLNQATNDTEGVV